MLRELCGGIICSTKNDLQIYRNRKSFCRARFVTFAVLVMDERRIVKIRAQGHQPWKCKLMIFNFFKIKKNDINGTKCNRDLRSCSIEAIHIKRIKWNNDLFSLMFSNQWRQSTSGSESLPPPSYPLYYACRRTSGSSAPAGRALWNFFFIIV